MNLFVLLGFFSIFLGYVKPTLHQNQITGRSEDASITKTDFGQLNDGRNVFLFRLRNLRGMTAEITNYGAAIVSVTSPDRNGKFEEVTLGLDSLKDYLKTNRFFGAAVGRYGNRIAKGKFVLDGTTHNLTLNNNGNHLHGGNRGFDKVLWEWAIEDGSEPSLVLSYTSKDGEEGYPGNLTVVVIYTLLKENTLRIKYSATSDKATIINLTNHTYFNLCGDAKRDILDHRLSINSDKFLPVDSTLIPLGYFLPVRGTAFDFTTYKKIGAYINDSTDIQLRRAGGYDHAWAISKTQGPHKNGFLYLAASLHEPESGRILVVRTSEPAIQFNTGNRFDGTSLGRKGVKYKKNFGLCLETEHFPDSPNHSSFPSTVIRPNQIFTSTTIYQFLTDR